MKKLYILLLMILMDVSLYSQFRSTSIFLDSSYCISPRIGYTTNYGYANYENSINYPRNSGPRRSAERPYSGNFLEDLLDWWRMNTDSNWPSYVEDEYWIEFLRMHPEYEDEAEEWFRSHGQTPPWQLPIGDSLLFMSLLSICYTFSKLLNNKLSQPLDKN